MSDKDSIVIRRMEKKDKLEVLSMMRVFYDSPAVFYTASNTILERDFYDCIGETPFIEGFVFEISDNSQTHNNSIIHNNLQVNHNSQKNDNSQINRTCLAGYAMIAPSYTTEYGGKCIWIEDIYIKPDYRRKGLATRFFSFIEENYPDAVRFKLEVEQENEGAIENYKRNGYGISPYFEMTKEMPNQN